MASRGGCSPADCVTLQTLPLSSLTILEKGRRNRGCLRGWERNDDKTLFMSSIKGHSEGISRRKEERFLNWIIIGVLFRELRFPLTQRASAYALLFIDRIG